MSDSSPPKLSKLDCNVQDLKKSLTLDFSAAASETTKKALQTPEILRYVALTSPELEKIFTQGGVKIVATPTPTQFFYPQNVTAEQEQYARGFLDALQHLHRVHNFIPASNLLSPGFVTAAVSEAESLKGASKLNRDVLSFIKSTESSGSSQVVDLQGPPKIAGLNFSLGTSLLQPTILFATGPVKTSPVKAGRSSSATLSPIRNTTVLVSAPGGSSEAKGIALDTDITRVVSQAGVGVPQLIPAVVATMGMARGQSGGGPLYTIPAVVVKNEPVPSCEVHPILSYQSMAPARPGSLAQGAAASEEAAPSSVESCLSPPAIVVDVPSTSGPPSIKSNSSTVSAGTSTSTGLAIDSQMPLDPGVQEHMKLERKRARNRLAATKCRKRKLERITELEAEVDDITEENRELERKLDQVKSSLEKLRKLALEHSGRGCVFVLPNN